MRVIQVEDKPEKRKEDEQNKKQRRETTDDMGENYTELEKQNEITEESRWEDPELEKQRWEKMLEERERRI